MFQLSYEGRACCMSNKNVQLANVANESSPTLQAILVRVRVRVRVRANPHLGPLGGVVARVVARVDATGDLVRVGVGAS